MGVTAITAIRDSYNWFSPDVIVAKLVQRTKEKKPVCGLDLLLCKPLAIICKLFLAPTWPSYHVIENHL